MYLVGDAELSQQPLERDRVAAPQPHDEQVAEILNPVALRVQHEGQCCTRRRHHASAPVGAGVRPLWHLGAEEPRAPISPGVSRRSGDGPYFPGPSSPGRPVSGSSLFVCRCLVAQSGKRDPELLSSTRVPQPIGPGYLSFPDRSAPLLNVIDRNGGP
jgi:hypothetical protein